MKPPDTARSGRAAPIPSTEKTMKATTLRVSVLLLLTATALYAQSANRLTMEVFRGLEFRSIGPSLTTGRISDLEIDPNDPNVWYLTVGSSGLWKTVNRGNTWMPIFDEYPLGSGSHLVVPDVGLARAVRVSVHITNSDLSTLTLSLYTPLAEVGKVMAFSSIVSCRI